MVVVDDRAVRRICEVRVDIAVVQVDRSDRFNLPGSGSEKSH